MTKIVFGAAAAFATQTAEGTMNATLDAITTSLTGDPDGSDQGLIFGTGGLGNSGLTFKVSRISTESGVVGASFTKPISQFLRTEISDFKFSWHWGGSRRDTLASLTDADYTPGTGANALLTAANLVGAAWGGGNGWSYAFGAPLPISALIYIDGKRFELVDCRAKSLEIAYIPAEIPIATIDLSVGTIKEVTDSDLPTTLTYGAQSSTTLPVVQAVAATWGGVLWPWSKLTVRITPSVEIIPDSNATQGIVQESTARETRIILTPFTEAVANYDYLDMIVATQGGLSPFLFTVGTAAGINTRAMAHYLAFSAVELQSSAANKLGSKAAADHEWIARAATANTEMDLRFI